MPSVTAGVMHRGSSDSLAMFAAIRRTSSSQVLRTPQCHKFNVLSGARM